MYTSRVQCPCCDPLLISKPFKHSAHHSSGTADELSVYTSRSNVQGSSSSGRKVTLAVI